MGHGERREPWRIAGWDTAKHGTENATLFDMKLWKPFQIIELSLHGGCSVLRVGMVLLAVIWSDACISTCCSSEWWQTSALCVFWENASNNDQTSKQNLFYLTECKCANQMMEMCPSRWAHALDTVTGVCTDGVMEQDKIIYPDLLHFNPPTLLDRSASSVLFCNFFHPTIFLENECSLSLPTITPKHLWFVFVLLFFVCV